MIAIVVGLVVVLAFGLVALIGAPYVPSLRREVRAAFAELRPLSEDDVLVDLGSGDGVVMIEAVKHGARCIGYEINPFLVILSRIRLGRRAEVRMGDMWRVRLPADVTLVYAFSVSRDSGKLGRLIQAEASRLKRPVQVMTFGAPLKGYVPIGERKAHSLYEISPK